MAAKIEAAKSAVAPGSTCGACVVALGSDLNCIRSILSHDFDPSNAEEAKPKGTLFVTPGSDLEKIAMMEIKSDEVRIICTFCEQNVENIPPFFLYPFFCT